jgi:hypothetical protein
MTTSDKSSLAATILWRRLDRPGHEYARLERHESSWTLSGVALFEFESASCRLDYSVSCDSSWLTTGARVSGWVGSRKVEAVVTVDNSGSWRLNGAPSPDVRGCFDVDLNFSPSTNLLPIRRLALAVGESAEVHAAWLRFPSFTLERLDQIYTRLAERTYRYESSGGFRAEVRVNEAGLPISYGTIWSAVATG